MPHSPTSIIYKYSDDWLHLATMAHNHPVSLHSLVPLCPTVLGAADASKLGMGGFWLPATDDSMIQPSLWCTPFPVCIQQQLLTTLNPAGTITNSDLELTAVICGVTLAAQQAPAHSHQYSLLAMDNTPALAWLSKGSTTTNKAPAYLLQLLARLRHEHDFHIAPVFMPGTTKTLADCCLHLFHLMMKHSLII